VTVQMEFPRTCQESEDLLVDHRLELRKPQQEIEVLVLLLEVQKTWWRFLVQMSVVVLFDIGLAVDGEEFEAEKEKGGMKSVEKVLYRDRIS
jgi:hypothetical protein